MANFEFTQNLSFGQFIPTGSWIHQRDARARILFYLFLLIGVTIAKHFSMLIIGLAFVLAGFFLAKISVRFALNGLKTPLPFLIIIAILQLFRFQPEPGNMLLLSIGSLSITVQGILSGFTVMIRFVTLILIISLATFTISTSDLIYGLKSIFRPLNWLKIPSEDLIMIFQITLRFLPLLGQSTEQIAKAQAARGAAWGIKKQNLLERVKTIYPVIIPMFLTSLQKAENMALAMDARGYGININRGSYKEFKFNFIDGCLIFIGLLIATLLIIL